MASFDITELLGGIQNWVYDKKAKSAGYDPSSDKILSQLSIDYNDRANPANADAGAYGFSGLNIGQIVEGYNQQKLLEDLIEHYGKRFGKPQKKDSK